MTLSKKTTEKEIALVTGANRGIGLEVCRQLAQKGFQVILAARDLRKAEAAAGELSSAGTKVDFCEMDVSSDSSVATCAEWVSRRYGKLDVLVNNAGVFLDGTDLKDIRASIETNTFGPIRTIHEFGSLLKKSGSARVINVSSGMGQLSEMEGGYPGYRISKTALNAVTCIAAKSLQSHGVSVNSICPGWVKTDMGGVNAEREVAEGADTIVWLATQKSGGPTGGFFRDREKIDW